MQRLPKEGHWYRSRAALEKIGAFACAEGPYVTPDGFAVMVCDFRGRPSIAPVTTAPAGGVAPRIAEGPALVVQAEHGHDLLRLARVGGQPQVLRVEFSPDELPDLEPLVEYDHLPAARKDYTVYPRGHKLA